MRLSSRTVGIGLAVLAALAVLVFWPRAKVSPEDEIRALVAGAVQAAEKKDVSGVMEIIADDFRSAEGLKKPELKQLIFGQLFRDKETVAIFNPTLEVTVSGTTATFSGSFVFARAKAPSVETLPEGGVVSRYQIDATLEKRDGQWRVLTAKYRQQ